MQRGNKNTLAVIENFTSLQDGRVTNDVTWIPKSPPKPKKFVSQARGFNPIESHFEPDAKDFPSICSQGKKKAPLPRLSKKQCSKVNGKSIKKKVTTISLGEFQNSEGQGPSSFEMPRSFPVEPKSTATEILSAKPSRGIIAEVRESKGGRLGFENYFRAIQLENSRVPQGSEQSTSGNYVSFDQSSQNDSFKTANSSTATRYYTETGQLLPQDNVFRSPNDSGEKPETGNNEEESNSSKNCQELLAALDISDPDAARNSRIQRLFQSQDDPDVYVHPLQNKISDPTAEKEQYRLPRQGIMYKSTPSAYFMKEDIDSDIRFE